MRQISDGAIWNLSNIQQSDKIRIILADSTIRGEVLRIVNAGSEWIPSWEILLEAKGGLFHWRQREHGGRVERLAAKRSSVVTKTFDSPGDL
jgi:hypothetical protein